QPTKSNKTTDLEPTVAVRGVRVYHRYVAQHQQQRTTLTRQRRARAEVASKMGSDGDRDRRQKSRKHHGGGGGRRDSDRHRKDATRGKERDRRSRKPKGGGDDRDLDESNKLTEEEQRLYAKAKRYVEREEKDNQRRKHTSHGKEKYERRRRSDGHDSNVSTDSDEGSKTRDRKRSHKRGHKRKKNDERSSRHVKKSKHTQRHREKEGHSDKNHAAKSSASFKDKATSIDSSKLISLGDSVREPPMDQLDPETNYFSHSPHLRLYLYRKLGIYFEDLSSSESHDAFKEFVHEYNAGKLEKSYYDPSGLLPQDALDQCSRTKHQWKFRVNSVEAQSLEVVRAGVKKQTEYNETTKSGKITAAGKCMPVPSTGSNHGIGKPKTPQELAAGRQSDRQHRQRLKLANEEMFGVGGKADHGWERKLEKRREQSEKLHRAAKDRESEAWGGAEMDDDAIYGSAGVGRGRGEATYEKALERERRFRERKEKEKSARTSELLKKEEEKQKKMFEMLGLTGIKAGKKITIAPRNDAN
ncbi:hypothetical protein ACHAWF_017308, partial [Thalassiosira exigua]